MKVAVIHDTPIPPQSVRQLFMAFMRRGVDAAYLRISRMSPKVGRDGLTIVYGRREVSIDAAVVKGLGLVASTEAVFKRVDTLKHLRDAGTYVVNPPEAILNARDKLRTIQILRKSGLPIPDTLVSEDLMTVVNTVKEWGRSVLKPLMGSMGYGSILTEDPDVAFMVAKVWISYNQPVLIQRYMRLNNRDIRVFVVGDKVLGAIYRYAPEGSWKTNVAQGARVERAELSTELEDLALSACKALGLLFAGVDIGETRDGYVIYEVNSMPNWSGFMEGTGVNPAEHIADLVISMLKK